MIDKIIWTNLLYNCTSMVREKMKSVTQHSIKQDPYSKISENSQTLEKSIYVGASDKVIIGLSVFWWISVLSLRREKVLKFMASFHSEVPRRSFKILQNGD